MAEPASPPAPVDRAQVPPADAPGLSALLTLAVGVVVVAALYLGRDVLVPIMLAVLLSFILAPLVALLRRIHLGRVPSVIIAVLLALGVIGFVGGIVGTQVASLASNVPSYAATVQKKVAALRETSLGRLPETLGRLSRQLERAGVAEEPVQRGRAAPDAGHPIPVEVHEPPSSPLATARNLLAPILAPLETTLIVIVVAIFVLLQREDLRDRLIRLFGSTDLHRTTTAMDEAGARLSRYFLTQLALNTVFGCVIATGLYFIGVPSPLLWGIVAALLRFVPYIGAFLAAGPPLVLAAAVDPGWSMVIWTAILFVVAEPIMGYIVEPMVYGHSTGLSPVSVVVAAIFWTWLWGPIGLILSTPLTLCLVVLGRHVERLEFLDVMLGDRPALTPVESFYQRMLAGDPDEALDQAEQLLRTRSLSSYYDEVALRGLRLAAADAARGVLGRHQLDRVNAAVKELVSDLADHDDLDPPPPGDGSVAKDLSLAERALPKEPAPGADPRLPDEGRVLAPWRAEGAVLCVAGRGPLDESASAMLAQLLAKHGIGVRALRSAEMSRERLAALPAAGVLMICISYVAISGNPTALRLLVRRIRQRFPGVPIMVGLWPSDDPALRDRDVQSAIGADHYVASLRDAVNLCLAAATDDLGFRELLAARAAS